MGESLWLSMDPVEVGGDLWLWSAEPKLSKHGSGFFARHENYFGVLTKIPRELAPRGMTPGTAIQVKLAVKRDKPVKPVRTLVGAWLRFEPLVLSVRCRKRLLMFGVQDVKDLRTRTADELMGIRGFGAGALAEVREQLAIYGWHLKQEN